MSDMTNVLYTGQDNLLQSRLDRKQMVDFIATVADRAKAADDALTTEMHQALNLINQKLVVIDRKAEVFDKPETEALEAAFQQFLNTAGVSSLLGAMAVELNGASYSVSSVLNALVTADKIVSKEILAVDADELPTSVRYTLHDGYVVTVPYERTDDAITGKTTIIGSTADWHGLTATDTIEFQKLVTERQLFGAAYKDVRFNLTKTTNITFDLSNMLIDATPIASAAPDLDGDGVIGTPPAGG
jgi:hypothetical protein